MVTIPMSRNVRSGCKRHVQPDGPTTLRCGRCFPPARRPRSRSSRLDTLIARSAEENDAVDPDDARSAEESEKPVEAESTALDIQSANYMSFPMSGCEFLVPEDDEGRLDLCNMYVRDEKDGSVGPAELEGEPPEAPSVYHCVTWDMEDLGDAMKNKAPMTTTLKVILVRIEEEQQPITWEEYQAGLEQLQLPESAAPEGEAGGQAPPGEGAEGQREEVTATLAAQEEDVDDEWRRAVADEDTELLQEFMNERILKLDFGNVFVLDSESRKGQRLNPDVKGDLAAMENPVLRITAYGRVTIEDEHLLPDPESVVQEFEAREAGWEPEEVEEQEQDFDDEEDMDDTPDVPAVDLA